MNPLICVCCGKAIEERQLMNWLPIVDAPVHVPECPLPKSENEEKQ